MKIFAAQLGILLLLSMTGIAAEMWWGFPAFEQGGVIEEITMRWGVMSFLVWLGWQVFPRSLTLPSKWIYQLAIVLAALLFALLHLPATATLAPLTPALVSRAIVGNGILGIAYGWLFWQYSLEAAILAHASFHIVVFVVGKINL